MYPSLIRGDYNWNMDLTENPLRSLTGLLIGTIRLLRLDVLRKTGENVPMV
jgi:hypothetical protein